MNTQLKKGILELCVLSVISKQDSYGYEIIDQIKDKIPMSEGTIYPMLRRLKNDKYLEDYTEQSES
ncbi:MAG: PadR family transcriptional regulator, partial [Finegoldia magna]|nr:PadR family transcriptional regulator [Finegoldia magna]